MAVQDTGQEAGLLAVLVPNALNSLEVDPGEAGLSVETMVVAVL